MGPVIPAFAGTGECRGDTFFGEALRATGDAVQGVLTKRDAATRLLGCRVKQLWIMLRFVSGR